MSVSSICKAALAAAALLSPQVFGAPAAPMSLATRGAENKFAFGSDKIRGVNLGGWFVLEPWITPSLFEECADDVVDEWTMSASLGKEEMKARMEKHWSTWYTASDFAEMASLGLNFVRIPIGYWSVSPIAGEPYVQGAYEYLHKAIGWAGENGLMVMIDLHGAPGSQNGFDNSGRKGAIEWGTGKTFKQTHKALNKIRNDHAQNPNVATIELVNEPMGSVVGDGAISQFYYDGWGDLKKAAVAMTIHDAFEPLTSWNSWGAGLTDVMVDTHHYEVFDSGDLGMSTSDHVSTACSFGSEMASLNKWCVAGEWTGAMTDCAKWLNGRGIGARYDGTYEGSSYIGSCDGLATGTVAGLSSEMKQNIGSFIQAQMVAFEQAAGWIFWTWHTESAPEWDFQALSNAGVIPSLDSLDTSICSGSWSK